MPPIKITASILSANLGRLQSEIDSIETSADAIQVDVMDGHFVPNLTFGAPVITCLKTALPLDIHLMVTNPADRVDEFAAAGAANITFHAEAVTKTADRKALINSIKAKKMTAGIAINPATPLSAIDDVVDHADLVLVMSVNPGFSGQAFMPDVLEKVRALRSRFPALRIQMDGGINVKTVKDCREAGANDLVAASAIFSAKDRAQAISDLRG